MDEEETWSAQTLSSSVDSEFYYGLGHKDFEWTLRISTWIDGAYTSFHKNQDLLFQVFLYLISLGSQIKSWKQ